ncbi:MAG: hypothetical protein IE933_08720 [Sphingomonadales bacterium]|nr:hypothetical protein [Sphingomonadales bacterium]MBD3774780.1 hypothetical protein [Paracoccaceae bacterium]MBD3814309.1 hypothetical protein [Betaproteobacteria bacterium]
MRLGLAILPLLALSACGGERERTPAEQRAEEDKAIAANEKPIPITPQPILFPDIEKNDLFGASCAFVPDGGGVGAIFLAMDTMGAMKIDDEIVRFAPDRGSAELPMGIRSNFDGKAWSVTLAISGDGEQTGIETTTYKAALTVRDAHEKIVYSANGSAQCGS